MTTVYLLPTYGAGWQGLDASGNPLNAGQLFVYQAGTSTPLTTYTTSSGTIQNSNPVVLNADGRPPNEIWIAANNTAKVVLEDANNNVIETRDNLPGINDSTAIQSGAIFLLGNVAGTNTLTATGNPTLTAYSKGNTFILFPANQNTGATTINIDSLGAKNILSQGVACSGAELRSGIPVQIEYDGTSFNILGSVGRQLNTSAAFTNYPSSATWGDLTSLTLTPGDWDLNAQVITKDNTVSYSDVLNIAIGTVSGNTTAGLSLVNNFMQYLPPTISSTRASGVIVGYQQKVTTNTIYYLKYMANYSAGTPQAQGQMTGRQWK